MAAGDFLYVVAASYDDVKDARADLESVRGLYDQIKASDQFDAAVLVKDEKGKVQIEKTYEAGTRHGALKGLGWGLRCRNCCCHLPCDRHLGCSRRRRGRWRRHRRNRRPLSDRDQARRP